MAAWTNNTIAGVSGIPDVVPTVNIEQISPEQHGGLYGTVYRMYFGSSLPSYLATGTPASKMIDSMLHFVRNSVSARYSLPAWSDAGTGTEYIRLVHNGLSGSGSFAVNTSGCTLVSGWVDYIK